MHVEITTTVVPVVANVTGNYGGEKPVYRVAVAAGALIHVQDCAAWEVVQVRNRAAERWSNIADTVHAGPIPEVRSVLGLFSSWKRRLRD